MAAEHQKTITQDNQSTTQLSAVGTETQVHASLPTPSASGTEAASLTTSSSAQSTVSRSLNLQVSHTILSFSTMDAAFKELQNTLDEATAYQTAGNLHPKHIQLHIEALKEDTEMLTTYDSNDEDIRNLTVQLIHTAKRMRRHLERDLVDLQIAGKDSSMDSTVSTLDKKSSALKLTPLQLPRFDGDASNFIVYKNFFEENIIHNSEMSETSKWLRLKESLSGHPAKLISEILQSENMINMAWKLLTDNYGGDERPVVELYSKLHSLPPSNSSTEKLRLTHSKLEGLILSLEQLNQDVDVNHFIRWTYMGKFPSEILYQVQRQKNCPLKEVRQAINEVISARECTDLQRRPLPNLSSDQQRRRNFPQSTHDQKSGNSIKKPTSFPKALKCTFCEQPHWNDQCTAYSTIEARTAKLTGKCLKCLCTAHIAPCAEERRCYHCDSLEHYWALCPIKFAPKQISKTQLAVISSTNKSPTTGQFLTCIAKVTSQHTDKVVDIRIVLNTGGGTTLATKSLIDILHIPTHNMETTSYTGLNGIPLASSQQLDTEIHLLTQSGEIIPIAAELLHGSIPDVPTADIDEFRRLNPHCDDIYILPSGEGRPIELLIGSDCLIDVLKSEKINVINADTALLPTKLGSLIVGRRRQLKNKVCQSMLINSCINPLHKLSDLDSIGLTGIDESAIDDEEKAIQHFYATLRFIEQRYSISWPWLTYPPLLDSNFGLALGRLRTLYKRLTKTPSLLHDYHHAIQQQLAQGIIERVAKYSSSHVVHYLPHHPIIKPESSTSIRPVIDGSSKTSAKNKSLNDNIRKGTKWLNDLVATLIRVRQHANVVTADIARAFHQIAINEEDRDAARFLWLKDPSKPPTEDNLQIFRFTRVAFGIIASPFILHATIRHHANQQHQNKFIDILLRDMYADNLVSSLPDDIDPYEFYEYAKKFFASMSMNLTKWSTNVRTLEEKIPEENKLTDLIQSVLGIKWNITTDIMSLKQPRLPTENSPTP